MTNGAATALIVAAGRGRRLGDPLPKQYHKLAGVVLLRRTVGAFLHHPRISAVRVVIHPDDQTLYEQAVAGLRLPPPIAGGASRQQSVHNGLMALAEAPPDTVLIHDAARPFVAPELIDAILDALAESAAALPAVAVADTLKRVEQDRVIATVDRRQLWRAQTPQGFRFSEIIAAHTEVAGEDLTDDAAVAERAGLAVALVPATEDNFKITTQADLERAQRHLAAIPMRSGLGFDVHAFTSGDQVTLCGVTVPHAQGLAGHSDADVALHALTDAVLGALAEGDIGTHFPPSDPQWRGADSAQFVRHALRLLRQRGGEIVNLDITLICQAPKISDYRAAMVAAVAAIAGVAHDQVSVKATTTEGLGFTGRGEGIAAQALAVIRLP